MDSDKPKRVNLELTFFLLISIFSFLLNFESGRRGLFPRDQSIIFDGSYRILQGQIPYKDFLSPVGPLPFYIHALFFKLFGINYSSYILGSSLINLLATLLGFYIISVLFPLRRWLAFSGAFLTAIWFYPPSGTPYLEQTSFFFSILGITFLLKGLIYDKLSAFIREILLIFSGFSAFTAILSKQNSGFFILPLYILLMVSFHLYDFKNLLKNFLFFLAGFLAGLSFFFLFLLIFSDFNVFLKYFWRIPSELGFQRLFSGKLLLLFLRPGPALFLISFVVIFSSLLFILIYLKNYRELEKEWRKIFISSVLCCYLIIFHYLFTFTTNNHPVMGFPFIGIIFSAGSGIILNLFEIMRISLEIKDLRLRLPSRKTAKAILIIALFFIFAYISFKGMKTSLKREAHDIFEKSSFKETLSIKELKILKWGEPTLIKGCEIKREAFLSLVEFLKREKKNFFVFPDFTLLYGILGSPSPQPVLWFHKGLTYPGNYDPSLDEWIVKDLKKNKVEIVVQEDCSWSGNEEMLNSFSLLKKFLKENFEKTSHIGIFSIYKKKAFPGIERAFK